MVYKQSVLAMTEDDEVEEEVPKLKKEVKKLKKKAKK